MKLERTGGATLRFGRRNRGLFRWRLLRLGILPVCALLGLQLGIKRRRRRRRRGHRWLLLLLLGGGRIRAPSRRRRWRTLADRLAIVQAHHHDDHFGFIGRDRFF